MAIKNRLSSQANDYQRLSWNEPESEPELPRAMSINTLKTGYLIDFCSVFVQQYEITMGYEAAAVKSPALEINNAQRKLKT
jgi:hypothetical protein